ncbi:MAG: CinA family protein [Candidatus Leucobacter sulfamidivorax]|nr:CinA family protein [Candidatus Leucobacter sulfamidivorax]
MSSATAFIAAAAERGLRLAVAESLTGGLLASEFVAVPGSSRVFSGGVVAYDTALKRSVLGVDAELLRARGPVDAEVARQMARGVRRACAVDGREADIGIATTGVAGPEPDPQTGQPPGTVWVAVSGPKGDHATLLDGLSGLDRVGVRLATVRAAIEFAIRESGM